MTATQNLISPQVITDHIIASFINSNALIMAVDRQYDDTYANSGVTISGKIGPYLRVRKENRFQTSDAVTFTASPMQEDYVIMQVSTLTSVFTTITDVDRALTIDEFDRRICEPAGRSIAAALAGKIAARYYEIPNATGTPATLPNSLATAQAFIMDAKTKLAKFATPPGERRFVVGEDTESALVGNMLALFNPQPKISEMFTAGEMGHTMGFDFSWDQSIARHTAGTRTIGVDGGTAFEVNGNNQNLDYNNGIDTWVPGVTAYTQTLSVIHSGGAAGSGQTFKKGDVFTLPCAASPASAVYGVNPLSYQSNGALQQFTILANATADAYGVASLSIYPPIIIAGIKQTVTAAPISGQCLVFSQAASSVSIQNLAFKPESIALVTADLVIPGGVDMASRRQDSGISMRLVRQYDSASNNLNTRIEVLHTEKVLVPEQMVRAQC